MTQFDHTSFLGRSLSTLIILLILDRYGQQSGYSLLNLLRELSTDMISPKAGTLYPQIDNLHKAGYVNKDVSPSKSGRTKEISMYTINHSGQIYLRELSLEWLNVAEFIEKFIRG